LIRLARNRPTPTVKSRDGVTWKIKPVQNAPTNKVAALAPDDACRYLLSFFLSFFASLFGGEDGG
jgi:hypothetical protein